MQHYGVPPDRRHLLTGSPWRELCRLAGQMPADVIVLGASQHPRLERALLGTTAEAVAEHAPCDVLTVKPPRSPS